MIAKWEKLMLPITFLQIYMSASNKLVSFFLRKIQYLQLKHRHIIHPLKIEWIAFYEKKRKKQNNWPVCVYMYVCVINNHHTYIVLLFTLPPNHTLIIPLIITATNFFIMECLQSSLKEKKIQVKCKRKESNPTIKNEKPTFTINQESQNLSPTSYFNFPLPPLSFFIFSFLFFNLLLSFFLSFICSFSVYFCFCYFFSIWLISSYESIKHYPRVFLGGFSLVTNPHYHQWCRNIFSVGEILLVRNRYIRPYWGSIQ